MAATVSTSRFAALSASASVVAERLHAVDDSYARDCHTRIMSIHPRLRAERLASARAMEMLTAAKAAARRNKAAVKEHIDAALLVGKFFDWADICDFVHQKEATFFTVPGLAEALHARGAPGEALSARLIQTFEQSEAATAELERATAEYARAMAAFTAEYRALAAAIAFGRAVLADLGVKVPRIADAKRGVSAHAAIACESPGTAVLNDRHVVTDGDHGVAAASATDGAVAVDVAGHAAEVEPPRTATAFRINAFGRPLRVDATRASVARRNVRRTAERHQRDDENDSQRATTTRVEVRPKQLGAHSELRDTTANSSACANRAGRSGCQW